MQRKTIEKTIINKLEEWLKSITDESLAKDVRKNILVSGGSITSMFLGEPINDYDIYIKDMSVLLRLTEYYIKPYQGIVTAMDGRKKSEYETKLLKDYRGFLISQGKSAEDIDAIESGYTISLRNLKEDQIKLFFNAKNGGHKIEKSEKNDGSVPTYMPVFFSPNAISLSNDIQIVIRFQGDAEAIHKTFDFIHATNYFTFEEGLVTNKTALECILTKQLKYQGSLYPLTTIIRVRKFIKKGWNINAGELLKIMFQISELDLKNPDVLEEQLIGVDVAYFGTLIEVLRGVTDLEYKMTSQYLNTLIDKVFNENEEIE